MCTWEEAIMQKILAPLAGLAFLLSAGAVYAEDASSMITSVDEQTLTLEDGTSFTIGGGVSTEGLEPGTTVNVSYEEMDGQKVVKSVTPADN